MGVAVFWLIGSAAFGVWQHSMAAAWFMAGLLVVLSDCCSGIAKAIKGRD